MVFSNITDIVWQCDLYGIQNHNMSGYHTKCDYVKAFCGDKDNVIGLTKLYFCDFNESAIATILFLVIFLFVAFYLLASTAENYLAPCLDKISATLKCSETLAGVTLLALGNGASDIITSIMAGSSENDDDIQYVIGCLCGAGLFTTTIIVARVISRSPKTIKLQGQMALRDQLGFFTIVSIIIIYGMIGTIHWWMALIIIFQYCIYIVVVLLQEYYQKKSGKSDVTEGLLDEYRASVLCGSKKFFEDMEDEIDDVIKEHNQSKEQEPEEIKKREKLESEPQPNLTIQNQQNSEILDENPLLNRESKEQQVEILKEGGGKPGRRKSLVDYMSQDHFQSFAKVEDNAQPQVRNTQPKKKLNAPGIVNKLKHNFTRLRHKVRLQMYNAKTKWNESDALEKVSIFWEIPADLLRDITIPPVDEDWNQLRCIACCLTIPYFFCYLNIIQPIKVGLVGQIVMPLVGITLAIVVWKTSHPNKPPRYTVFNALIAFIFSLFWLGWIARAVIEFLNFVQLITRMSKVYLGMTFLAWGNSMDDFFTDPKLAEMGLGIMGLTACYAAKYFDSSMGFGFSLLLNTLKPKNHGKMEFKIFEVKQVDEEIKTYDLIQTLLGCQVLIGHWINIICMMLISFIYNYTYTKKISNFLTVFYVCIFVLACGLSVASDITRNDNI